MATVAYVGNFLPKVPFERRWSTEHQVALTLEELGHKVLRLQEDATDWALIEHVARFSDVLLWTTTTVNDAPGAHRTLRALRAAGVPTVGFHLDLYFGVHREAQVRESPFFRCEHVFTADGGHQREFAAAGVNHHWSPPAVYAGLAELGERRPEYECDVAFVGSYPYPHPEHSTARAELVRFLQYDLRGRFRLWHGGVRGHDLADLYASAKVVVGDSCLAGKVPRYWSDRIPETLGRGGFLVHPYVPGIEGHYDDGVHLRLFEAGEFNQLRAIVHFFLEDGEEERHEIAAAGRAHVLACHTYAHRMETLLGFVLDGLPLPWADEVPA